MAAKPATWSCDKCTYHNQSSSKLCEICGALRKDAAKLTEWKCSSCTFVNACSSHTCLMCGANITIHNESLNHMDNENEINKEIVNNTVSEPIQSNYAPKAVYCESIEQCEAIKRIIKVLHYYQTLKNINDIDADCNNLLVEYFEKYQDLINDYHHILTIHLNTKTKHSNNKNFEAIYNKAIRLIKCDIMQCKGFRNNNRNRGRPKEQIKDKKSLYYIDWLDSIHCYLLHSFDVGFRIKISDYYHDKGHIFNIHKKQTGDTDEINTNELYHDHEMERIKLHLSNKREKLEKIRGIDRLQHSKYNTAFAPIRKQNDQKTNKEDTNNDENEEEKKVDEVQDQNEVNLVEFFFGNRFLYWDFYKNNADFNKWYISKKYKNIKDEIINNKVYNIEHDQYIETYQKAKAILNDSFVVRCMKSTANYWYKIQDNIPLDIDHVLSIIFYTDYDTLSYNFSKTYRKTTMSESDETLKKRNSEYWNWGKLITESVECYGLPLYSSNISIFYHGTSMLYFTSFVAKFCCPTSTTPQIQVAATFAKKDGIILELERYALGYDLRYFNCSLFSCYANEDERLFAGGYKQLQLKSIRTISDNKNYQYFIQSLRLFDKFIHGTKLIPNERSSIRKRDYKIVENLIDDVLKNEYKSKHPVYIKNCFHQFCEKIKTIEIDADEFSNVESYNGYSKYLGVENVPHLVRFDTLCMIFGRCEKINIQTEGNIDECYIKEVSIMLNALNTYSQSIKLKYVQFMNYSYDHTLLQKAWSKYYVNGIIFGFESSTNIDGRSPILFTIRN